MEAAGNESSDESALNVQDVLALAITAHALMGSLPGPGGLKPFAEGAGQYEEHGQRLRVALAAALVQVSITKLMLTYTENFWMAAEFSHRQMSPEEVQASNIGKCALCLDAYHQACPPFAWFEAVTYGMLKLQNITCNTESAPLALLTA